MVSTTKKIVIAAALLGVAAFAVSHRWREARDHVGEWSDGRALTRSEDSADMRRAVWDTPVPIGGGLNSPADETRAAVSPDGRFVVFAVGSRGLDADLWIADMIGDEPVNARPLMSIDTAHDEVAPAFGSDALYFASDRPGGAGGLDVWRAPFHDGVFGSPARLVGAVNSKADDTDPACSLISEELLFASNRGGDFDLYAATPLDAGFEVVRLDELDTTSDEREPTLDRDGRTALFSSDRVSSDRVASDRETGVHRASHRFDIYRAQRTASSWTGVAPVDLLNSSEDDRAPLLLGTGFEAWFVRRGASGSLDVFRSRAIELVRVPGIVWSWVELASIASLLVLALLAFLAGRWPGLETIYKCFLVSVLVHLLILWWLQSVHVDSGGGAPRAKKGDRIRVHVLDDGKGLAAARSERAGKVANAAGRTTTPNIERSSTMGATLSESAASTARITDLKPVDLGGGEAPERLANTVSPMSAAAQRPLQVADAEPRATRTTQAARELTLSPHAFEGTRVMTAPAMPERSAAFVASSPMNGAESERASRALEVGTEVELSAPMAARASLEASDSSPRTKSTVALADAPEVRERSSARTNSAADSKSRDDALLEDLIPAKGAATAEALAPERTRFETGLSDSTSTPTSFPIAAAAAPDEVALAIDRPKWEGTPYENREGPAKARALLDHGGTVETERAVERGLAYLARIQDARGYFGPLDAVDPKYGRIAVGKTALCTLAFLGAGHTHVSATKYSANVARALAFLVAMQDETSGHFGDSDAYSHGIATYAIAEAFALTKDATLRASLEPAVQHILAKQSKKNDPRFFGGWSYYYSDERTFDRWPRTSITAWQVMALESARLSGVLVPDRAFVDAAQFLDAAHDDENDWYRYNHDPARLGSSYPTLPASTPAALFALSITGRDIGTKEFEGARTFVVTRAPKSFAFTGEDDFVRFGQGNPYFWYYGTLAMFRTGGGVWSTWNEAMKRTLLPAQQKDGSWKPIDVYARYARDDDRDRSYTTALCVLSLEVYYRYFLPLLKAR